MSTFLNNHSVRGLRNNNPGNLVRTSISWKGKIPFSQSKDTHFEQFQNLAFGIRAMLMDLVSDIGKGKNTIRKLINEYAPSFENNTSSYIQSVASSLNLSPDQLIQTVDRDFLKAFARAIMKVELGASHQDVSDSDIYDAIDLMGGVSVKSVALNLAAVVQTHTRIVIPLFLFFYSCFTCFYVLKSDAGKADFKSLKNIKYDSISKSPAGYASDVHKERGNQADSPFSQTGFYYSCPDY